MAPSVARGRHSLKLQLVRTSPGRSKGQRKILITPDDPNGESREYSIPRGVHVNVQEGDRVRAGDPLMDGPSNPHDILHVLGEKELQKYLVNEIQEVYRLHPDFRFGYGTFSHPISRHTLISAGSARRPPPK